ncbi:hypothetical protein BU23DRAFT_453458 [Bimuria novae-zelandiae CBS 107.79]|uniref:3'-5' exonuclease domain-containing protein n=1 Tax=Bimuria novae-zelandiae CBS 107.79 TaxID=1447943 RepID=A0A6A5VJH6_9PLEO|nr:hypothetical protein BU23DRAFT_453458 [Bimuria novae-zelandiae CBS 107.79]
MTITKFISTTPELAQVLGGLNLSTTVPPHLYVDLEGVNLSRNGSISILTLYDLSSKTVFFIDEFVDRMSSFGTKPHFITLKKILESTEIPKVFFDARNDSDALFAHFGIKLQGVQDLQVMELATRSGRNRERVNGLAKCIQFGLMNILSPIQRSQIQTVKDRGSKLFAPEKGGSFHVFNMRPLDNILLHYCIQDVVHMPALWHRYNLKLRIRFWKFVVEMETNKRLEESRSAGYVPQGSHKSLGWTWEYLRHLERKWNG